MSSFAGKLLLAAFLVLAGSARAQSTVLQEVYWQSAGANTWQAMYRGATVGGFPNIEPDPGGFARARSTSNIVLGSGVQVLVDRPITRSALAKTLTAGAKLLPVVGTVIAGVEIAREFGLWPTSTGWFLDGGNQPGSMSVEEWFVVDHYAATVSSSPALACSAVSHLPGVNTYGTSFAFVNGNPYCFILDSTGNTSNAIHSLSSRFVTKISCAAPADGGDPITYKNGRCSTVSSGAGNSASPDSVVEPAWDGILSDSTVDAIQLARNVQAKGWPLPTGAPQSSGPAEVQTGQKTTTGPEGTIVETIKQQLQYLGDKIVANAKVTNVQNTNITTGATTNTTSTTTNITTADPEDPCTANPDRIGCIKAGEAPEPDTIPEVDIPVEVTPWGSFGPSTGSCPTRSYHIPGVGTRQFDFTMFCDGLGMLRFFLIGICLFIAGRIVMGALKDG